MSGTHITINIDPPNAHGTPTELQINIQLDPNGSVVATADHPLDKALTAATDEYSYALATIAEHAIRTAIAQDKAHALINTIPAVGETR